MGPTARAPRWPGADPSATRGGDPIERQALIDDAGHDRWSGRLQGAVAVRSTTRARPACRGGSSNRGRPTTRAGCHNREPGRSCRGPT